MMFLNFEISLITFLAISGLQLVLGLAIGWFLHVNRVASRPQVEDPERQKVDEVLHRLYDLTGSLGHNVDRHASQVQSIGQELAQAQGKSEGEIQEALFTAMAQIAEANARLQGELSSAEKKLQEQAGEIESQMAAARTDALTAIANRRADFEFEITVDNLIGILMHSNVTKRDIVEECVFAWDGVELVLLPVNSEDYQASLKYTQKIAQNFSARSLVKGYSYNQKRSDEVLVYLGYYEWFEWEYNYGNSGGYRRIHKSKGKKHVFADPSGNFTIPGMQTLSEVNSEEVAENYSGLVESFFKTLHSQPITGIVVSPNIEKKDENMWGHCDYHMYKLHPDNKVTSINIRYYDDEKRRQRITEVNGESTYFNGESITSHIFVFENRETKYNTTNPHYNNNYGYRQKRQPDEFQIAMIAKAVELGYNPNNLEIEQVPSKYTKQWVTAATPCLS